MKFLIKIIFLFILFSCDSRKNNSIEKNISEINSNNLEIDTTDYSHLPYWSDTLDRFLDAYIDTFSINGNQFRFVNLIEKNQTDEKIIKLQKKINNNWIITSLKLEYGNYTRDFNYNMDINGDGFKDILLEHRFSDYVYFYDKEKNTFFDTAAEEKVNPNWYLLDREKNIYCDFNDYKQLCDQIHSSLYTYRGYQKVELFDLTLYNCTNSDEATNTIKKLVLKKKIAQQYDSTKLIEEINLPKPIDIDEVNNWKQYSDSSYYYFDYRTYWKDRYKKLIGSS